MCAYDVDGYQHSCYSNVINALKWELYCIDYFLTILLTSSYMQETQRYSSSADIEDIMEPVIIEQQRTCGPNHNMYPANDFI